MSLGFARGAGDDTMVMRKPMSWIFTKLVFKDASSSTQESPVTTETDLSDNCETDALEILSPPSQRSFTARKPVPPDWSSEGTNSRLSDSLPLPRHSPAERSSARSPPNHPHPQIWKPSSLEDDLGPKPLSAGLGRRNSVTSIKSTGSAGMRPSIAEEPIPERSDSEAEYAGYVEQKTRGPESDWTPSASKLRERERPRREHRKSSASDNPRNDEGYAAFPTSRGPYRADEGRPPPRDRYDGDPGYGSLRYHRSEEIPRPQASSRPPLRHESSFHEEYEETFHPYPPSRPVRSRASFEDRGAYPSFQSPPPGRVPSRPASTLNDERDYYDQGPYRPYPTPPSSASRSSVRDHMAAPAGRYPSSPSYAYPSDSRSNTLKFAQQPESPPTRRASEGRPNLQREPSYTQSYSDEPRPLHSSSDGYFRTYERAAASASIPIATRKHKPPFPEEGEGWRSWTNDSPINRRDSRRDSRYGHDRDDFQGPESEYLNRSKRDYEVWQPEPYYGPHPEPSRRKPAHPVRSPMMSHPGSYHDGPEHSFGGRDRAYESHYDGDEYADDIETDVDPSPRYRDRQRREDSQRPPLSDEELHQREAEEWRRQRAEEDQDRWREEERARHASFDEGDDYQRLQSKQEARKRKDTRRHTAEPSRLDEDWQKEDEAAMMLRAKEDEIRRQAEAVRRQEEELTRKAEEARIKEEEVRMKAEVARRKEEEARRKEEEVMKKEEEAMREKEEALLKVEEVRREKEDAIRKAEEARKKELEIKRKEVEAKEEARRVREANWQREQEMKAREEELQKREEELRRREDRIAAERRQKEEEESFRKAEKLQQQYDEEDSFRRKDEQRKREEKFRYEQQQEEFRRREQEIHERKRQDSTGTYPSSYTSSTASSRANPPPQSTAGTGSNGSTSGWSSSPKPGTPFRTSSASTSASKPRSGSMNSSFPSSTPSPHPPSGFDEAEFRRKQEEFSQQQQERFREQQRFEDPRQRPDSSKLTAETIATILDRHDRQWGILLTTTSALHWNAIPWPVFFVPKSPEDITLSAVAAYLQSPLLPLQDKSKPPKDRLKELIKKWHPDRFENKYLPRIVEGDREKVKEGMGEVIRSLNELLTKVNTPGPFGSP
ncbi:hypothetical protein H0H93_005847 [Arthromyces matolae]|nr:hypothetical protein H0H93_005847 [Arthromyces matolae]